MRLAKIMEEKMRNKKIVSLFLAALSVAGVLFFAGCSGSNSTPMSQTSQPSVTNSSQPTVTNSNDQSGLPPDPGEAGKQTLAGIDSDHDGVRDDVQRYIAQTYPNSAKTRAALTQDAKVVQSELLDANSKQLSMQHSDEEDKAASCLNSLAGLDNSINMQKKLEAVILNTDDRNRAYFKYNDQLGGEVFSLLPDDSSYCAFDVNTMSN